MDNMTTAEKIRLIAKRRNITLGALAEGTDQTRQNFSNKLGRGDFKESELSTLADFLGCDLKVSFVDRTTGEEV